MGIIGKDFNYIIVKDFLQKEEIALFNQYCEIMHRTNTKQFGLEKGAPVGDDIGDTCCHGDPIFDSLLLSKQDLIDSILNRSISLDSNSNSK